MTRYFGTGTFVVSLLSQDYVTVSIRKPHGLDTVTGKGDEVVVQAAPFNSVESRSCMEIKHS